jgi:AAA domain
VYSSSSPKFDERDQETTWRSFKAERAGAVGFGTIVYLARAAGWTPPRTPNGNQKAETADAENQQQEQPQAAPEQSQGLDLISAGGVKMQRVDWLWDNYIPRGKVSDIQGNPGDNKSTLTADFAARVTRGWPWPDDALGGKPGDVLILSSEDDARDTIVPRLAAAGADLDRVHLIGTSSLPTFPEDCDQLEQAIRKYDARMVVIDPLDSYLNPKIDGNKNSDVRRVLTRLRAVAEATGCAILMIRPLSKDPKVTNALYRGLGSIGYTGAARATFLVGRLPEDPEVRVLTGIKCNLGSMPPALGFKIGEVTVNGHDGEPIKTIKTEWIGPVKVSSRDMLTEPEPARHRPKTGKREAAIAFIKEFLGDGLDHSSDELEAMAKEANISHSTLWRAREDLGVRARKKGYGGDWLISLPNKDEKSNENRPGQAG